jgi:pimeloyl-ACP methyl ester carboxylesterase
LESPAILLAPGLRGRVAGEGEGVLWIHGYTLDSRSWGGLWPLVPGYRHVGVDLPGHGASDPTPKNSTLVDLAERLATLAEAHQIRHVVALSFGTIAALQLLIARPSMFASAVLAAPGISGGPTEPSMMPVYFKMAMLFQMAGRCPAITDLWMSSRAWRGIDSRPDLYKSVRALVDAHSFEELRDPQTGMMLHTPQSLEALAAISTPVLILAGDREMPAYRQCAEMLAAHLPHSRRVDLADTDHLCLLQSPEQSAPLIAAHLAARPE